MSRKVISTLIFAHMLFAFTANGSEVDQIENRIQTLTSQIKNKAFADQRQVISKFKASLGPDDEELNLRLEPLFELMIPLDADQNASPSAARCKHSKYQLKLLAEFPNAIPDDADRAANELLVEICGKIN
jgi:hypothetical protein